MADGHAPRQDSHISPAAASVRAWIVAEAEAQRAQRPLIVGLRGNRGNGPAKVRRCTQHIGGRLAKKERWGFSSKTGRLPEVKYIMLLFGVWKAQSKVLPFKEK